MLRNLFLIFIVLLLSTFLFAQVENENVKVQLSFANDKKVYQIGEPLDLILSFTSKKEGYVMNKAGSIQMLEEIWVKAFDSEEWKAPFKTFNREDAFAFANVKLSETPSTFNIKLNTVKGFPKVGKYLLKIDTKRVSMLVKNPTDNSFLTGGKYFPLTTNTVEIEVKEMKQDFEKEEIKRLMALLESEKDWNRKEGYAQDISFLRGDAATTFKVENFLNPRDYSANFGHHNYTGLMLSQNKALAVKLLEDAFYDLNREIRMSIISTLTQLRILQEFNDSKENSEQRKTRFQEITQNYINQLFKSLPNRKRNSLRTAAVTLFQQLPKEDVSSNFFNTTKAIILSNFDEINPYDQNHLLEHYWEKLKTPELIPSLERILSREKPVQYLNNANPLKRMIELDQKRARPFVIKEICNPQSVVGIEVLGLLNDKLLPEVDACLVSELEGLNPLKRNWDTVPIRIKSLLAARFATKKIYKDLMNIYETYGDKWLPDTQGSLLGYFLKYNDKETIDLLKNKLLKTSRGSEFTLFLDLTKVNYSKHLNDFFAEKLESSNFQDAGTAAYLMAKNGNKENRKLIEKRYQRWLNEWMPRKSEFENPDADNKIKEQIMFQINLIEALKIAKSWKLTPKELETLKQTCFSQDCLRYFPKNHL